MDGLDRVSVGFSLYNANDEETVIDGEKGLCVIRRSKDDAKTPTISLAFRQHLAEVEPMLLAVHCWAFGNPQKILFQKQIQIEWGGGGNPITDYIFGTGKDYTPTMLAAMQALPTSSPGRVNHIRDLSTVYFTTIAQCDATQHQFTKFFMEWNTTDYVNRWRDIVEPLNRNRLDYVEFLHVLKVLIVCARSTADQRTKINGVNRTKGNQFISVLAWGADTFASMSHLICGQKVKAMLNNATNEAVTSWQAFRTFLMAIFPVLEQAPYSIKDCVQGQENTKDDPRVHGLMSRNFDVNDLIEQVYTHIFFYAPKDVAFTAFVVLCIYVKKAIEYANIQISIPDIASRDYAQPQERYNTLRAERTK